MDDVCIIESEKIRNKVDGNFVDLVLHTILKLKKQVLVFNNSKRSSQTSAHAIANAIKLEDIENKDKLEELSMKIYNALPHPTSQCRKLRECIKKGVAFHHSGLVTKQRTLIEKSFREGLIKAISSTPTLAAGLNLPAYKVIIKDYKRYSQRGMIDIPILEYHQMAGRAGRPGSEDIGKTVLCVKDEKNVQDIATKYVFGESEEIISKLAVEPTLKMYILSLISMDMINTKEEIKDFFKSTLYAHQYQDIESLNFNVFRIIDILKDYKFVSQDDDYYMGTELGKKISKLYLNPDTANYFLVNLPKFVKRFNNDSISKYDVYSVINFFCNTLEMRPLFRAYVNERAVYEKTLEDIGDDLIVKFDPFESDIDAFLNSLKTSDVFESWISEAPEDYISDKYNVTPGELNYKVGVMDWLLYCLEEIAFLKKELYFKNFLKKLRVRFQFGIKSELLPLVALKGIGRTRARKLFKSGYKKLLDIKKADEKMLARVVGEKIAISLKEQMSDGQEVVEKPLTPKKPSNIKAQYEEDVSEDEIDVLITNYNEFEEEKKEVNMNLTDYF